MTPIFSFAGSDPLALGLASALGLALALALEELSLAAPPDVPFDCPHAAAMIATAANNGMSHDLFTMPIPAFMQMKLFEMV
jgi:hypothetical protein